MVKEDMMKLSRRSNIWLYFNECSKDRAKCSLCSCIISTKGGSTSNLRRHLNSKHNKKLTASRSLLLSSHDDKTEEEIENMSEGNSVIILSYDGETLPSEIIIENADSVTELDDKLVDEEKLLSSKTKIYLPKNNQQTRMSSLNKQLSSESQNLANKKLKILTDMANSLSRLASSSELIAECFSSVITNKNINTSESNVKDKEIQTDSLEKKSRQIKENNEKSFTEINL